MQPDLAGNPNRQHSALPDWIPHRDLGNFSVLSRPTIMMSLLGTLSLLLAIPVIGAVVLLLMPRRQTKALFTIALLASSANFFWSLSILNQFDGSKAEM